MTIHVVILAYTLDQSIYEMNQTAMQSLREAEPDLDFNFVLVESNKDWRSFPWLPPEEFRPPGPDGKVSSVPLSPYGPDSEVILPNGQFNFNAFNNAGMGYSHDVEEWILFSNNDVVFHPGCISALLAAHQANPDLVSLCPVDPESPHTPPGTFHADQTVAPGYLVRVNFTGWCFLVKSTVFDTIGNFDPRFDYYFADDDFCMQLRRHSLLNAAVPTAHVTHLAHVTSKKSSFSISDKFKEDQQKFRDKWGPQRMIAWKNRLTKYLLRPLGMKGIIRKLYRPK